MNEAAAATVPDAPAVFAEWMASHGLSLEYKFIPLSQSRNAPQEGERNPRRTLNWRVSLVRKRNGNESVILVTEYHAGEGSCPANIKPPVQVKPGTAYHRELIEWECEHGFPALWLSSMRGPMSKGKAPIVPNDSDVMGCLASDSDVLNYRNFEDWAECFGYDADSRKAEAIYKACLETALALRNGIGEAALAELQGIER